MRLLTIIAESMLMEDLDGLSLSSHVVKEFDPSPAQYSCHALWMMMTDRPCPRIDDSLLRSGSWFAEGEDFIGKRHRVRIVADFWPRRYDPTPLDPKANKSEVGSHRGLDPECWVWKQLMASLGETDVEWLIYWPLLGHVDFRVGAENEGIPRNLKKTCAKWAENAKEILGRVDCPVLLHTDHGTCRKNMSARQYMHHGFCMVPKAWEIGLPQRLNWEDIRKLECKALSC